MLTLSPMRSSRTKGTFYGPHVGTGRKSIDRPRQRADEIQTGAAAGHGGVLRDSLRAGGCQGWQVRRISGAFFRIPADRKSMLKDGWKSVGRVFILAIVLDVIYQIIELHFVYVGEAFIVAFILAIVPYLILRGLVTRIARRKLVRHQHAQPTPLGSSQRMG